MAINLFTGKGQRETKNCSSFKEFQLRACCQMSYLKWCNWSSVTLQYPNRCCCLNVPHTDCLYQQQSEYSTILLFFSIYEPQENTFSRSCCLYCHAVLTLSQLPAASNVFSQFTAISDISALCPLKVARSLPSELDQIFTKLSSAPWTWKWKLEHRFNSLTDSTLTQMSKIICGRVKC